MPLPPLVELLSSARVVALPLRTRFRGIEVREAMLFEGPAGWTEFSPFVEYDDAEAAAWLSAAIDFGWRELPVPLRTRIPVNATIPAVAADEVAGILARYAGCRTAKVKVAGGDVSLADDVARVAAVRAALGPEGRIRVDANGNWNVDEAEHAAHALEPFDLEYIEQPCATVEELVELRRRVRYMGIPVAADESVRRAEDPLAVAEAGAADLLGDQGAAARRHQDRAADRGASWACPWWSRAPSTPASGWRWAPTSPRAFPIWNTTAGSARPSCSPPTSRAIRCRSRTARSTCAGWFRMPPSSTSTQRHPSGATGGWRG